MKNRKFAIFAAIVAVVVGFAIYDYKSGLSQEKKKQEQSSLFTVKAEQVKAVRIQGKDQPIELEKTAEGWRLTQPLTELADQKAAQDFVDGIVAENSTDVAVEGDAIEMARFGLESPAGVITLTDQSGAMTTFKVGNRKNFQGDAFIQRNDEKKIFVGSATWFLKTEKKPFDFRDKRLMKLSNSGIQKLWIKNGKDRFELIQIDGQWQVGGQLSWKLDQNKVRELLASLNRTEALEYIADGDAKRGELESWGLLDPRFEIRAEWQDGKTWAASLSPGKDNVHRAWVQAPSQVMKISPTDSDQFLRSTADSFRDRAEPFQFDKTQVKSIELKIGKSSRTIDAQEEKARKLLEQLKGLSVAEFKESPQNQWMNEIKLKNGEKEVFAFQWGELPKDSAQGKARDRRANEPQMKSPKLFPARTSGFSKTFMISENEIASLKLDEFSESEETVGKTTP